MVLLALAFGAGHAAARCGLGPDCGPCDVCQCGGPLHACACVPAAHPCDDGDACTLDTCVPFDGCHHVGTRLCCTADDDCEDGDLCTTSKCLNLVGGAGVCGPTTTKSCDDGSAYTADSCDPSTGECRHAVQPVACGGANDCPNPVKDVCADGLCERFCSLDADCPRGFICGGGLCVLGECQQDSDCDDHRRCTGTEKCDGHRCVPGLPILCLDDGNPCTTETCTEALGCTHFLNANACDDGNACTTNDQCTNGECHGQPACDDGDPCTSDLCLARFGSCAHVRDPLCSAGSTTTSTTLEASTTTSSTTTTSTTTSTSTTLPAVCAGDAQCDDGDACTADRCSTTRCVHLPLRAFAAILCRCESPPPACAGQRLPRVFTTRFARGCGYVHTAASTWSDDGTVATPTLADALKKFTKGCRAVDRAVRRHRVSAECGDALQQRCATIRARTQSIIENGVPIRGG